MTEFETKRARLHALLAEHDLDALLLRRVSSFAWATCGGDSYINTADSYGTASLLITPADHHLITDNIEAPRLEREEKRWIVDIEAFEAEGYVWEDVEFVPCLYLRNLPDGETIPPDHGPPPQP